MNTTTKLRLLALPTALVSTAIIQKKMKLLYKYRGISSFKNFVDILINRRLYAAPYFDMNDPMEGHYVYPDGMLSEEMVKAIKGEKDRMRICSLSRDVNNMLMWAHYAEGHTGVAIGVTVDENKYDVRSIKYIGVSNVQNFHIHGPERTAQNILTHKYEAWAYEEEERIFVTDYSKFADIEIKEIHLGSKMKNDDKKIVKELIKKFVPEAKTTDSKIKNIV